MPDNPPATNPETQPIKTSHPMGACNGNPKINFEEALKLKYEDGMKNYQLAKRYGVTNSAITQRLKPIDALMKRAKLLPFMNKSEAKLQELSRSIVLQELLKPAKLKKASVNNLAYAYDKLKSTTTGSGVNVTIELVFQEAEAAAKKIRRSAADIIINKVDD